MKQSVLLFIFFISSVLSLENKTLSIIMVTSPKKRPELTRSAKDLIIALKNCPKELIIDEIFAGGDINFVDKAVNRINNLIDSAKIVIMVSHSMNLIEDICNRCLVISDNTIVFDGETKDAIKYYKEMNGK